jgi:hypothetical protein
MSGSPLDGVPWYIAWPLRLAFGVAELVSKVRGKVRGNGKPD